MQFRDVSDEALIAYVKDDSKKFGRLVKDKAGKALIADIMSACSVNAKLRERVVAKILGLEHNLDVNGWDAKDINSRPWEIKTEQGADGIHGQLKWHYTSEVNLDKYTDQPLVYAPFTPSGQCIFICGFSVRKTGLLETVKVRKKAVNFSVSPILEQSLIYYFNPRFLTSKYLPYCVLNPVLEYVDEIEESVYGL